MICAGWRLRDSEIALHLKDGLFDSVSTVDTDKARDLNCPGKALALALKFHSRLGSRDVNQPEWQLSKCR